MSCPGPPTVADRVTEIRAAIERCGVPLLDGIIAFRQLMNMYPNPDVESALYILEEEARAERRRREDAEDRLRLLRSPFAFSFGLPRR